MLKKPKYGGYFKGTLNDFNKRVKMLEEYGYVFETERYGSTAKIHIGGKTWAFTNNNSEPIRSMCSRVKKNVNNHMRQHKVEEVPHKKVVHYNMPSITKHMGEIVAGYDIRACYWNIAHNSGYISTKTYEAGLDLKTERLVAIGSLNKVVFTRKFTNNGAEEVIPVFSPTSVVWESIIYQTWEIYHKLREILGEEDFVMWLTDCVYFDPRRIIDVRQYFADLKLEVKPQQLQLIKIEGSGRLIAKNLKKNEMKTFNVPYYNSGAK